MKTCLFIIALPLVFLSGCDDGNWVTEKQLLEDQLAETQSRSELLEKRIADLSLQLEKEKKVTADIAKFRDLAKEAHSKLVDLNIAALNFPTTGSIELKQSSAVTLLMINDVAKQACADLDKAISGKE